MNNPLVHSAGALVHVYTDGTVLVTHGGVEMGQGLHTKIAQIAASSFCIPLSSVFISETSTDKIALDINEHLYCPDSDRLEIRINCRLTDLVRGRLVSRQVAGVQSGDGGGQQAGMVSSGDLVWLCSGGSSGTGTTATESCSGGAGVADDAAWRQRRNWYGSDEVVQWWSRDDATWRGGADSRLRGRTTPPRCRSEVDEDRPATAAEQVCRRRCGRRCSRRASGGMSGGGGAPAVEQVLSDETGERISRR
ncbi:hypothetical protein Scep_014038 [Stephania cephalantha]|uniref:Aldehyde oxidase/xanthine dehydrogenase second molybdopterin binding domain-containing protein n=1 Tax=Stephania cephalantha TaxID=152367 RepID=A0AAP0J2J0_9MAGN